MNLLVTIGGSVVVGIITGVVVSRDYWKLYKKFRRELAAVEKMVCEQAGDIYGLKFDQQEFASLKYRMDILEGKHLRARNLGIGLPQPRAKDKDSE